MAQQHKTACWRRTDRRWVTTLVCRQQGQGEVVAERKVKITFGGKGMVDATEIPIEESNEKWSDVKLQDGAHLRVKSSVINAVRVDGQYDPATGNPVYVLNMTPTMIYVDIPENLRQKK